MRRIVFTPCFRRILMEQGTPKNCDNGNFQYLNFPKLSKVREMKTEIKNELRKNFIINETEPPHPLYLIQNHSSAEL